MHNIDRTQLEYENTLETMQPEAFEFTGETAHEQQEWETALHEAGLHEQEMSGEYHEGAFAGEYANELPGEGPGAFSGESGGYAGEYQEAGFESPVGEGTFESGAFETGEWGEASALEGVFPETGQAESSSYESVLGEAEEMELASEFLEITNEQELDQFLGKMIRRVGRGIRKVVRSPLGRALGGMLRPLAKAALPIAGRVVGGMFGGPAGAMLGGKLAPMAGRLFGLELEGLSGEDREFEVARRFVRFGSRMARTALAAPPHIHPTAATRTAFRATARRFAPGLLAGVPRGARPSYEPSQTPVYEPGLTPAGGRRQGVWIRRGRRILLMGV